MSSGCGRNRSTMTIDRAKTRWIQIDGKNRTLSEKGYIRSNLITTLTSKTKDWELAGDVRVNSLRRVLFGRCEAVENMALGSSTVTQLSARACHFTKISLSTLNVDPGK